MHVDLIEHGKRRSFAARVGGALVGAVRQVVSAALSILGVVVYPAAFIAKFGGLLGALAAGIGMSHDPNRWAIVAALIGLSFVGALMDAGFTALRRVVSGS